MSQTRDQKVDKMAVVEAVRRLPVDLVERINEPDPQKLWETAAQHYHPQLLAMGTGEHASTVHGFIVHTPAPVLINAFSVTAWRGDEQKTSYVDLHRVAKMRVTCLSDNLAEGLSAVNEAAGRRAKSQVKCFRALNQIPNSIKL